MRIVCPACAAAYELPEGRVAPGQVVRCARCGADWTPIAIERAPEPEPEPETQPEPAFSPPPAPEPAPLLAPVADRIAPPPPPRPRGRPALAAAWALSFVALGLAAWGAYARREDVMRVWPASERAYSALGIARGP